MTEESDTLLLMEFREKSDEIGQCLIWTGAMIAGRYPSFKKKDGHSGLVRREVFRICKCEPVPGQPIDSICDDKACINPKHLIQSTTARVAQKAAKKGAFSGKHRRAKIAATKRLKAKLTMEAANEIRISDESGPILAARYGVNNSLINRIKRGDAWVDFSSPYYGLMAA